MADGFLLTAQQVGVLFALMSVGYISRKSPVSIHSHKDRRIQITLIKQFFKLYRAVYRQINIFQCNDSVGIRLFVQLASYGIIKAEM